MNAELSRRSLLRLGLGTGTAVTMNSIAQPAQAGELTDGTESVVRRSFWSQRRGGVETRYTICYPPGYAPGDWLPVLICLHGTGGCENTPEALDYVAHSWTLLEEGTRSFACVGVAGGDTWWHPRTDGTDSSSMVAHELMPRLGDMGLDVRRPALYGLSMGAVGATWLASWLGPDHVSSLTLSSMPWTEWWARYPGAYDSEQQFRQQDVRARWSNLRGIPIRLDVGTSDDLYAENARYAPALDPKPEFHTDWGGHDWGFWKRSALQQFRFAARHFG